MAGCPATNRWLCPIDYAPFIHNLFDGSLINICPRRAYLLANSDTGVTPLSAASAGEFP
jgi:DNA phosphorothioation-dependent restriction protein DptG